MIKYFKQVEGNEFIKIGVVDKIPENYEEVEKIKKESNVDELVSYEEYMKNKED